VCVKEGGEGGGKGESGDGDLLFPKYCTTMRIIKFKKLKACNAYLGQVIRLGAEHRASMEPGEAVETCWGKNTQKRTPRWVSECKANYLCIINNMLNT
jgi:hypothetical protein